VCRWYQKGASSRSIPSAPAKGQLLSADLASAFAAAARVLDGASEVDAVRAHEAAHSMSAALTAAPGADPATVVDECGVDREALADALSHAADYVADIGSLATLAGHLHAAGWWWTEPLRIFDDGLLDALRSEAALQATTDEAPVLATLCASDAVADAAGRAAGRALAPAMAAAYQFDEDLPIHLDREPFSFVMHVVIEHRCPDGVQPARLRVVGSGGEEWLSPGVGEGLVLAGRGTLHGWEPLAEGEHRTMIAIGLAPG
jgi:hypothetical protein